MQTTTDFFMWFFSGLNGLGGWFLFFLLAMAAVIFVLYDTARRRLPALAWKMGIVLVSLLLLPVIIFRFAGAETQASLQQFSELFFYLGLLGGVLPPVIAVGYYVTYKGLVGCPQGHVYEAVMGQCPECNRSAVQQVANPAPVQRFEPRPEAPPVPIGPVKPKAPVWLIATDGRTYQLYKGETTIGRASSNDIQLGGDDTLSRQHAKITEQNGHCRIHDLAANNGTFVNGNRVHGDVGLEDQDEIRLGDSTILRFKC